MTVVDAVKIRNQTAGNKAGKPPSSGIVIRQLKVHTERSCAQPKRIRQDNQANLYKDEAMRMLVVLASFAALIGVATPAHADPAGNNSGSDASFLAALNKAGITYQDPATAVAIGKRACELMDQGNTEVDVIKNVSSSNPGFTVDGAAQFTMIAASAYCPQHLGQPVAPAPPTPLPPQQWPIIDFPIITPGAG